MAIASSNICINFKRNIAWWSVEVRLVEPACVDAVLGLRVMLPLVDLNGIVWSEYMGWVMVVDRVMGDGFVWGFRIRAFFQHNWHEDKKKVIFNP